MQAEGDNGNLPITNTLFPPPPDYYTAYTSENVAEWDSRRDEALSGGSAEAGPSRLDKPREDWVREEGRWMCFGQMYTVRIESTATTRNVSYLTRLRLSRVYLRLQA